MGFQAGMCKDDPPKTYRAPEKELLPSQPIHICPIRERDALGRVSVGATNHLPPRNWSL